MPLDRDSRCRKCHARKSRCPGGQPRRSCVQLGCAAECTYPKRDRQVKVSQSYLESLLHENERLRTRAREGESEGEPQEIDSRMDAPSQNPLLDEKPWFLTINSSSVPILIGEVADAAFATRFRQLLKGQALGHIPRISYPGNDQIAELACNGCPRPPPTYAHFLIRAALKGLDGLFHIVQNSYVWELLKQFLQTPQSINSLSECKILALFALGELYSSRSQTQSTRIPGLAYFSHASRAHGKLEERPCVDSIEISLLLCLYALCVNRRHSAYFLASSAVRHGVVMGLHFNLPDAQIRDPEFKEHLKRLWWTSYILDHMCASISSQIVSIPDHEIFVDLPTSIRVNGPRQSDLDYTDWIIARVQLAKHTREAIQSIYGRQRQNESFLRRVQYALRDLKNWLSNLPDDIRMDSESSHLKPERTRSLHLAFNQSVILATRPVLLHLLRMHKDSSRDTPATEEQNVQTLADACIRCARHSYATVVECWLEGSFKTFDYLNTQYLFSSATILAISSLLSGSEDSKDQEDFDFACQLLQKLHDSGSPAAAEFCRHIEAMRKDMQCFVAETQPPELNESEVNDASTLGDGNLFESAIQSGQFMTSGMALAEPSLEAFLQSEQSPSQVNLFLDSAQLEGLYWPANDLL
ncbi:fungal-specific transcription factor domain-containing protein [Annulohypoxylon moriforme]|nr:fungal-specific transcription factor domain-containing protein [Annulohypoxylon moriforme]